MWPPSIARFPALFALGLLAACSLPVEPQDTGFVSASFHRGDRAAESRDDRVAADRDRYQRKVEAMRARLRDGLDEEDFERLFPTVAQAREMIADRTVSTFSTVEGQQIAYLSSNGRATLWSSGVPGLKRGEWRFTAGRAASQFGVARVRGKNGIEARATPETQLCVRYGVIAPARVGKKAGRVWRCQLHAFWVADIRELRKGDPFGLAGRADAPFVLRTRYDPLQTLLEACASCE